MVLRGEQQNASPQGGIVVSRRNLVLDFDAVGMGTERVGDDRAESGVGGANGVVREGRWWNGPLH